MSEIRTQFEYIHFKKLSQFSKARRFSCRDNKTGDLLGYVRWYNWWKQHCFLPCEGTVYSADCLRDIVEFIEGLMCDG